MSLTGIASGQKIPLYKTLDSVRTAEKAKLAKLESAHAASKVVDSVKDTYDDRKGDIRDLAGDYTDSMMDHADFRSHFELGFDFASHQYLYGRQGPAYGVVGSPNFDYIHKTGFYGLFNADVYELKYQTVSSKVISRNPKVTTEDTVYTDKVEPDLLFAVGFHRLLFDYWDLEIFLDHTFYLYGKEKNYLASSFDLVTGYNFWDYITANVGYTLYFGGSPNSPSSEKKYSNILTFDLSHDFKIYHFKSASLFTIQPVILTDVGNDNYVRGRLRNRNENGGLGGSDAPVDNFFGLLDLDGAVNLQYRIRNLEIGIGPHILVPFNVVPSNATSTAPYRNNQTNGPVFYATFTLRFLIDYWKEHR